MILLWLFIISQLDLLETLDVRVSKTPPGIHVCHELEVRLQATSHLYPLSEMGGFQHIHLSSRDITKI